MPSTFDHIAYNYDQTFTNSTVGRLQRQQVWSYIENAFPKGKRQRALELGCGTGEDILMLEKNGFTVLATDVSMNMIERAKQKMELNQVHENVQFQHVDLNAFDAFETEEKFDLVFSNFGALNCISPEALENVLKNLLAKLKPDGRVVFVLLQKTCAWEILYFMLKFKVKSAFRRWQSNGIDVNVQGIKIKTWYYSPRTFVQRIPPQFELVNIRAVGCAVPPSYMESFFSKHPRFLRMLARTELVVDRFSFSPRIADHFLADLRLK